MFNYIIKKYIKDYTNVKDSNVRFKYGIVCSVLSIILNLIMVIFKLFVGFMTHSVAIVADGYNNLSDMGSNIATLFGFQMSNKHPDNDHPYGHGRYEYIAGLIISFLIIAMALTSIKESVMKIIEPEVIIFKISAVIVLVVSIFIKLWMASFNKKAAKLIQSTSLKAASQDSYNDVFLTLSTLISLLFTLVSDMPVDGIVGTIVSLLILKAGYDVFRETVDPLLGQAPDKELVSEIYEYIKEFDKVIGIHDFIMHDYGPGRRFVSFHAEVDSREDIMAVHDQIDLIERGMLDKFHILTTIHMDPLDMNDELTNQLRLEVMHIVNDINSHYSIHDFRIVSGPTHTNLIFDVLVPADDQISHKTLRNQVEKKIKELSPNYFCVIQIDHSYL